MGDREQGHSHPFSLAHPLPRPSPSASSCPLARSVLESASRRFSGGAPRGYWRPAAAVTSRHQRVAVGRRHCGHGHRPLPSAGCHLWRFQVSSTSSGTTSSRNRQRWHARRTLSPRTRLASRAQKRTKGPQMRFGNGHPASSCGFRLRAPHFAVTSHRDERDWVRAEGSSRPPGVRTDLAFSACMVDRAVVSRPLRHELVRMRAAHPEERVGQRPTTATTSGARTGAYAPNAPSA